MCFCKLSDREAGVIALAAWSSLGTRIHPNPRGIAVVIVNHEIRQFSPPQICLLAVGSPYSNAPGLFRPQEPAFADVRQEHPAMEVNSLRPLS